MPPSVSSFSGEYLLELNVARNQLMALAGSAPDALFEWRPVEGVRTFSAVLVHVAAVSYGLLHITGGQGTSGNPYAGLDPTSPPPIIRHMIALESMVNWVTYTVLDELWGSARLQRAAADELWRAYNPNHAFVVEQLLREPRLSRTNPLTRWLAAHPRGSAIFATLEGYAARAGDENPVGGGQQPGLSGTSYGLDLGSTYDGRIFVAYVDRGSPADRAGIAFISSEDG